MRGIPADLDLSFLHGKELVQVCLGVWQVQFHFEPTASLAVEGDWELTDAEGRVIDRNSDTVRDSPFHLHLLLQRVVVGTEGPHRYRSRCNSRAGGLSLRVFVSGNGGESFSIELGNIFV